MDHHKLQVIEAWGRASATASFKNLDCMLGDDFADRSTLDECKDLYIRGPMHQLSDT